MNPKRIAILGAGPIGLEAAAYARRLGHHVTIYERGDVAENVRKWGFVRLFTPWNMNVTPMGLKLVGEFVREGCPTGAQFRDHYLLPLANSPLLKDCLRLHTRVITIGKEDFNKSDAIGKPDRAASPFRILLVDATGAERVEQADLLIDCTGTYGNHRWAGRGGIPAPGEMSLGERIWYTLPDVLGEHRDLFVNRHTLLLGCGFSAATVLSGIEQLARDHPQTRLSWAIRRPGQALQAIHGDPLPQRRELTLKTLAMARQPPPWLEFLGTCVLEELAPSGPRIAATLRSVEKTRVLQIDELVALVGYLPDSGIYEQLQIHECYATAGPIQVSAALLGESTVDCLTAGASLGAETLKNPEPDFFILGAKSYGTNSHFLLQVGHKQIVDAFRLIQNDPKLNLYEA